MSPQEKWGLLEPSQKELYWDAMLEKYGTVVSLGKDLPHPFPLSVACILPSPSFPRGAQVTCQGPYPVPHLCKPLTCTHARTDA